MNKEEILNEIEKTKEHLANLENMLKECENERWKPNDGERYYYVCDNGYPHDATFFSNCLGDKSRYNWHNVFKTDQEAKTEAEKILVRRILENIARKLNKGQKIDWNNEDQNKYFICFNHWRDVIILEHGWKNKFCGVIYCLDKNFLDVALKEIGEGRLKKYLRGE